MKTYQIYLIRHGFTQGNMEKRYIGRTDLPLTDESNRSLREMREKFKYPYAGAYFSAPHMRCKQTVSTLYPDAKIIEIPDFRECNFGMWEERTAEELKDEPMFEAWLGGNGTPPNGESGADFFTRVCAGFEKVVEGMMKTGTLSSVIVLPAGAIVSILSNYGLPKAGALDWMCDQGCGYAIRIQPQLWTSGRVFEIVDMLPYGAEDSMIEFREAANRAYGNTPDDI